MNAMEKVAWTEFLVSVLAVVVVTCLYPWLGERASGAFGLLGLMVFGALFLRRHGSRVVVDERDRQIAQRATSIGVSSAWMTLLLALIAAGLWSNYLRIGAVSTSFLNWLTWTQFAVCYGVKGLVAIIAYRRQPHAS